MQKEVNTEQVELNTSQSNAEKTHTNKPDYLIIHEEIPNSPFHTVKTEHGWFLRIGSYRLTEYYETKTEVLDYIIKEQWNLILQITAILCENILNDKQETVAKNNFQNKS